MSTARAGVWAALAVVCVGGCMPEPPGTLSDGGAFTGPACVSGTYWGRGEEGDNEMHPGHACISCHASWDRGPVFSVAGTLFHDFQEADDCNGFPGDYTPVDQHGAVEVIDATGQAFVIVANRVGNFYTTHPLRYPLQRVRVRAPNGMISEMLEPAPHGDCNACHTREGTTTLRGGTQAPGRVVIPQ